jgi:hypothetical protein
MVIYMILVPGSRSSGRPQKIVSQHEILRLVICIGFCGLGLQARIVA